MTSKVVLGAGGTNPDPQLWCIDAAGMKGTTNYVPVWERGFRGMSGYIAGFYDIPQACIDAWWELPDTWWMLNYERSPSAGLGGATIGESYARDGLLRIRDKGHLRESALIFSFVDFGPTVGQFSTIDDCHHAMVDVLLEDNQRPGAYGPPSYLRHLAVQPWWPSNGVLWQWGGGGPPEWWTTCKQAGPNSTPPLIHDLSNLGFAADENRIWSPMDAWTGYGLGPQPQPSGDDVRHFVNNSESFPNFVNDWGEPQNHADGAWPPGWLIFEMVPGGKQHVSGAEWAALVPPGTTLDPRIGFVEQWTTGRIQSMPNVRHPSAATGARELVALDVPSVPGRATAVY